MEWIYFKSRMTTQQSSSYEESIQISIHELGNLLLKNVTVEHSLFEQICLDLMDARTVLFEKESEKYRYYLLFALLSIGEKLVDGDQWVKACPYFQKAVVLIKELATKDPQAYENMIVMPTLNLARGYAEMKDYSSAAACFIDLCAYFESKLSENSEYLTILTSLMLSATEALFSSGQKEEASNYISKAMTYLPAITDPLQKDRLSKSFEELIQKES